MRILGCTCVFVVLACSVIDIYKRVLGNFLGILLMDCATCLKFLRSDFVCGFLVFGCFRQVVWGLGLYVLLGLSLKLLEFGLQCWGLTQCLCVLSGGWSGVRTGFGSKNDFDGKTVSKISSSECGALKNQNRVMMEEVEEEEECGDKSDDEHGNYDENGESDVVKLRKLVKIERERANAAYLELEKERMAAATAAEETMAMILRLQNEKSVTEMEAHQYRRLAEEKQLHDQAVIKTLRWIVMRCESGGSLSGDSVRLLKRDVKLDLKDDEGDQSNEADESSSFHSSNFEDGLKDRLVSSLDMGSSSCFNYSDVAECSESARPRN